MTLNLGYLYDLVCYHVHVHAIVLCIYSPVMDGPSAESRNSAAPPARTNASMRTLGGDLADRLGPFYSGFRRLAFESLGAQAHFVLAHRADEVTRRFTAFNLIY